MNKNIILASTSPRRKEILKNIGLQFEVIPSQIEENLGEIFSYKSIENVALEKAENIKNKIDYPAIIIASDTVVVIDEKILGKPENENDAFKMLKLLSGKTHKVISAIALIDIYQNKSYVESVTSEVVFKDLSDNEIKTYIKSKEPIDKAGAYAVQGLGSLFVKEIKGCYFNIVGISAYKLAEMLKNTGINLL